MKRIVSTLLIAMLGGFISLGVYKLAEDDHRVVGNEQRQYDPAVRQVSYSGIAPDLSVDFTRAAELTVNAVVHVKTESMNEAYNRYQNDPLYQFFYGWGFSQPHEPKPVLSAGSGVIISEDGFIVTNNHVVENADKIEVMLNNNRSYEASVIGTDPTTDIALLKIEERGLPYILYGNSDETRIGEWVLAVGNPFNLTSTVTAGIVSAKGRSINVLGTDPRTGLPSIESFIQTDAAVNPGNSGGALVNIRGELVGINSAIKSQTGSYIGYSFAIPSNIVNKVVRDLKEFGTVQRAFIGISIRNIDDKLAREKDLSYRQGVYVMGITENGAAEEAGLQEGDIITKVGNVSVDNVPELQEQVGQFRPGEEVLVTLKRDDKEIEKKILLKNFEGTTTLVKREKLAVIDMLGANFESISKEEQEKLKLSHGLKVTKLWNGKLLRTGMKEGFIILRVDNQRIEDIDDLTAALEGKSGGVLFEGMYPNGRAMYYGLGL